MLERVNPLFHGEFQIFREQGREHKLIIVPNLYIAGDFGLHQYRDGVVVACDLHVQSGDGTNDGQRPQRKWRGYNRAASCVSQQQGFWRSQRQKRTEDPCFGARAAYRCRNSGSVADSG